MKKLYLLQEQLKKQGEYKTVKKFIREEEARQYLKHSKKNYDWNNYKLEISYEE